MKVSLDNAVATQFRAQRIKNPPETMIPIPHWCDIITSGAIYSKLGWLVPESLRPSSARGDKIFTMDPHFVDTRNITDRIEGKSAFLGHFSKHYGHFISETLSRFWSFETLGEYDNLIMFPFGTGGTVTEMAPFHEYIFARLGVDTGRIRVIDEAARFDRLDVFSQKWLVNGTVDPGISKIYRKIVADEYRPDIPKMVFLSRPTEERARLDSVDELEHELRKLGFHIFYPSQMTIQQQLQLYASCEVMAGFSGSGMHNVIFSNPQTVCIEIGDQRTPHAPITMQKLAFEVAGIDGHFVPYNTKDPEHMDIENIIKKVSEILSRHSKM